MFWNTLIKGKISRWNKNNSFIVIDPMCVWFKANYHWFENIKRLRTDFVFVWLFQCYKYQQVGWSVYQTVLKPIIYKHSFKPICKHVPRNPFIQKAATLRLKKSSRWLHCIFNRTHLSHLSFEIETSISINVNRNLQITWFLISFFFIFSDVRSYDYV